MKRQPKESGVLTKTTPLLLCYVSTAIKLKFIQRTAQKQSQFEAETNSQGNLKSRQYYMSSELAQKLHIQTGFSISYESQRSFFLFNLFLSKGGSAKICSNEEEHHIWTQNIAGERYRVVNSRSVQNLSMRNKAALPFKPHIKAGTASWQSIGLMNKRLQARVQAGAAGEFSSPEFTFCADSHSVSVHPCVTAVERMMW